MCLIMYKRFKITDDSAKLSFIWFTNDKRERKFEFQNYLYLFAKITRAHTVNDFLLLFANILEI